MEVRPLISRRAVLGLAGVAAVGAALGVGGCSPEASPRPEGADAKAGMVAEINALPASPIKSLLVERTIPYFTQRPPFMVTQGDFRFPVGDVVVHDQVLQSGVDPTLIPGQDNSKIRGGFTPRGRSESLPPYKVLQNSVVSLPLSLIIPGEAPRVDITFDTGGTVFEGVSPEINIYSPDPTNLSSDERAVFGAVRQFSRIKEAGSLLFDGIINDRIFEVLSEGNKSTTLEVADANGQQKSIEAVHQISRALYSNNGQFTSLIDIGG
jgi:hypothetical protein